MHKDSSKIIVDLDKKGFPMYNRFRNRLSCLFADNANRAVVSGGLRYFFFISLSNFFIPLRTASI